MSLPRRPDDCVGHRLGVAPISTTKPFTPSSTSSVAAFSDPRTTIAGVPSETASTTTMP